MPKRTVAREGDWSSIGAIVLGVNGRVRMMPCHGISDRQHARLEAVADQVWMQGLPALCGWRFNVFMGGWVTGVRMR